MFRMSENWKDELCAWNRKFLPDNEKILAVKIEKCVTAQRKINLGLKNNRFDRKPCF